MTDLAATIASRMGDIDGSALLASHRMPLPATFSFSFFGMPFDVGIRRLSEGGAELVVRGRLGNVPYSAESVAARKLMFSVVDAGRSLPMAEIKIDRNQGIVIRGMMTFQSTPSPAIIAAGTAAIAIAVKPVCKLIAKSHDLSDL